MSGQTKFTHGKHNLWFTISYKSAGHILIEGEYKDNYEEGNLLKFEMNSDQTYLTQALADLKRIVTKYGDNMGKLPTNFDQ